MPKIYLILFGTSACHLCEHALAIVDKCQADDLTLCVEHRDIADNPEWQAHYATRIPVLYHPETQQDLGWPFELADVTAFIESLKHD